MKIGIDIMGGDYAPTSPLEGIAKALPNLPDNVQLVLIGNEETLNEHNTKLDIANSPQLDFIPASDVIDMSESPTKAFSQKTESSIYKGFEKLSKDDVDVFVSAGNTGAMMVGSLYTIKAIQGVLRPAITTLVPKGDNRFGIMLDVGANPDCKQEVLHQFGILGSEYLKNVFGIEEPRVGLLNIGEEKEKGNLVTQAAYPNMEQSDKINFIGNVEGYDLFKDKADVFVCDGFTGNIVLKAAEGIFELIKKRDVKDEYFSHFNFENHGGTPILGVNKPVIIGHGVSTPAAFENMIKVSQGIVNSQLVDKLKKAFES